MDAIYALDVVLGLLLVMLVAVDEVGTLVTTRRLQRRSPTQAFYRYGWKGWAAMARRVRDENRRESFLSVFGPISLLGLLVVWIALFMVGWALIWLGLRDHIQGVSDFPDAVYFAGTTFFTVGFGDIVAIGNVARILTLFEALTGVLTTALVIGYLPTLYGAYSRREVQLLLLDDLEEDVVTPAGIITSYGRSGDLADLDRSFRGVGALVRRRLRHAHGLPDAHALPLAPARPVVDHGTDDHARGRGVHLGRARPAAAARGATPLPARRDAAPQSRVRQRARRAPGARDASGSGDRGRGRVPPHVRPVDRRRADVPPVRRRVG